MVHFYLMWGAVLFHFDSASVMAVFVSNLFREGHGSVQGGTRVALLLAFVLTFYPGTQSAQAQSMSGEDRSGVAFSVQASTMGPSVGLHFGLSETVRLRARGAFVPYSYSRDIEEGDVDARVDGDLKIGGPELRLDWHPGGSSFHLSGGLLYNLTGTDALVTPTSSYEFNENKTFSRERIGKMDAEASYSTFSPYAGLGFGNALNGAWGFRVELGTYYVGSPTFDLEGEGLISPTERNEAVLTEGFESFQFYPHFAFGLSYQF